MNIALMHQNSGGNPHIVPSGDLGCKQPPVEGEAMNARFMVSIFLQRPS